MRGEGDFFADIENNRLPRDGGVFYIRGGYYNIKGQTAAIQNPNYPDTGGPDPDRDRDDQRGEVRRRRSSELFRQPDLARRWPRASSTRSPQPENLEQSAIIITYDESDGLYDHVPPRILSYGPDGLPLARGIRIPLLLISPYRARRRRFARRRRPQRGHRDDQRDLRPAGAVEPAGRNGRARSRQFAGVQRIRADPAGEFQQKYLGPRDTNTPITDSLLSGFSPMRLKGAPRRCRRPMRSSRTRRSHTLPALRRQRLRGDRRSRRRIARL